jgi:tRNA U55 pseudouridine synthase TruB
MYVAPGARVDAPSHVCCRHQLPHATLRVRCGSGTYMRTLCDDVGRALDTAAHMSALQRTLHGDFALGDALGEAQWTSEAIEAALRQPERTVEHAGDGDGSGDDDDDGEAGGGPPAAASA